MSGEITTSETIHVGQKIFLSINEFGRANNQTYVLQKKRDDATANAKILIGMIIFSILKSNKEYAKNIDLILQVTYDRISY